MCIYRGGVQCPENDIKKRSLKWRGVFLDFIHNNNNNNNKNSNNYYDKKNK